VEWYDPDGKRHKRRTGINQHTTIADRLAAAEQLIEEIKRTYEPEKPSAQMLAEQWLEDEVKPVMRPKTYLSYRGRINRFFEYLNGHEPTPALVEQFFTRRKKELHGVTYNKLLEQLRKVFREIGLGEELTEGLSPVRAFSKPDLYFQKNQVKRLKYLISKEHPALWRFVQFVYYCFIRPNSELRLLQVMHLMLDDQNIYIPGDISKNNKSQYVAIPECFLPELRVYEDQPPNAYLFPSTVAEGEPVSYNYMYYHHSKFLKRAGFPKGYTLYSWKHTGAVHAAQAGVSLKDLQIQMRHHSLDQTDQYLRQMGVSQMTTLNRFPEL
jgi:integrase